MLVCPNCGEELELEDTAEVCPGCGVRIPIGLEPDDRRVYDEEPGGEYE